MKKLFALLLVALLVTSVSGALAAASTAEYTSEAFQLTPADKVIEKVYTTSTGDFPHETLNFTSTPDPANPDTPNLSIEPLAVTGLTGNYLTINVPSYSKVGVYVYTIKEVAGSSQGVTYDTHAIGISALVSYDYDNSCLQVEEIGVTLPKGETEKDDTFTNDYKFGGDEDGKTSLQVTKTVTGNLGDRSKAFDMTVTLTTEKDKYVNSDIKVSGGSSAANTQTIPLGWTGEKAVKISLKDGETVTFDQIPDGVSYKVVESDEYSKDTEINGPNGYSAPVYDKAEGVTALKQYPKASVTNEKDVPIKTGIILETLPYIAIIAVVVVGAVVMIARRRRRNDD